MNDNPTSAENFMAQAKALSEQHEQALTLLRAFLYFHSGVSNFDWDRIMAQYSGEGFGHISAILATIAADAEQARTLLEAEGMDVPSKKAQS